MCEIGLVAYQIEIGRIVPTTDPLLLEEGHRQLGEGRYWILNGQDSTTLEGMVMTSRAFRGVSNVYEMPNWPRSSLRKAERRSLTVVIVTAVVRRSLSRSEKALS